MEDMWKRQMVQSACFLASACLFQFLTCWSTLCCHLPLLAVCHCTTCWQPHLLEKYSLGPASMRLLNKVWAMCCKITASAHCTSATVRISSLMLSMYIGYRHPSVPSKHCWHTQCHLVDWVYIWKGWYSLETTPAWHFGHDPSCLAWLHSVNIGCLCRNSSFLMASASCPLQFCNLVVATLCAK